MQSPEKAQNRNHRRALLVVLFFTLCSLYMITYSARIESTDTLFLFDATGSLVRYGDLKLDTSAGVRPPAPNPLALGTQYPLPEVGSEPLQIILAAPLYALADQLPGVRCMCMPVCSATPTGLACWPPSCWRQGRLSGRTARHFFRNRWPCS